MVYYIEGERFPGHRAERHTKDGQFVRTPTSFRGRISTDPDAKFPAHTKAGRYHLYSSHACPWSHSATLARLFRGLEDVIGISFAHPVRDDDYGWSFVTEGKSYAGGVGDTLNGYKHAAELYLKADPNYTGYITLPVLWDTETQTIVSNESLDIIEMFNLMKPSDEEKSTMDLFPADIPEGSVKDMVMSFYKTVSNGVYRSGLSKTQEAYEAAVTDVFARLDELDDLLNTQRYLMGNVFTAADIRLFVNLVRFDTVYYTLFKCNLRRIADYPNLSHYLRDVYQLPGVAGTVFLREHIVLHYYTTFDSANPKRIVPRSGFPNLMAFHNRSARFEIDASKAARQSGIAGSDNTGKALVKGEFIRPKSGHRSIISADGSSGYKAEAGRYHLFIANNCPWCHRTQLARHVLGLQDVIGVDVLWYRRDAERGWQYNPAEPGCTDDTLSLGIKYIRELYERFDSKEKSVPVLWDKETGTIVNNESAEIMRMMNDAFKEFSTTKLNLVPAEQEAEIDRINHFTYKAINNGAYRAGFASTQEAYDIAHDNFFDALDTLDRVLQFRPFLVGDQVTEADLRLFPTIFRFDHVYFNRFLLRKKMIREYTFLYSWLQRMLALPGVSEASNLDHCKKGYFGRTANGLVPKGPGFMFKDMEPPQF